MNKPALPESWVDSIFKKLTVRYGQQFLGRWAGVDMSDVKADWAEQLGGFIARPDCIAWALDRLPLDKSPTAAQFRELANSKPEHDEKPKLDWKRGPIPANVMQELDRLKEPLEVKSQYAGPKGWAYRMRDREASGVNLPMYSRRAWREAIGGAA